MKRSLLLVPVVLCLLTSLVFANPQPKKETVRLAVASDFLAPAKSIAERFEAQTGYQVEISSGSSGYLLSQIQRGAPYDVFLSADTARPETLLKEGLAVKGSNFVYAQGKLALWAPNNKVNKDGKEFLQHSGNLDSLAIANPDLAPYGLAAKEALIRMRAWKKLNARLVIGENTSQAFNFVQTDNAQAGLVPYSQIVNYEKDHNVKDSPNVWLVPQNLYKPINQEAVLLTQAKNNKAAQAFVKYLHRESTLRLIFNNGFAVKRHPRQRATA